MPRRLLAAARQRHARRAHRVVARGESGGMRARGRPGGGRARRVKRASRRDRIIRSRSLSDAQNVYDLRLRQTRRL
jgi:hypothetical protein